MLAFQFLGIFERYANSSLCDIGLVEDNIEEYKSAAATDASLCCCLIYVLRCRREESEREKRGLIRNHLLDIRFVISQRVIVWKRGYTKATIIPNNCQLQPDINRSLPFFLTREHFWMRGRKVHVHVYEHQLIKADVNNWWLGLGSELYLHVTGNWCIRASHQQIYVNCNYISISSFKIFSLIHVHIFRKVIKILIYFIPPPPQKKA